MIFVGVSDKEDNSLYIFKDPEGEYYVERYERGFKREIYGKMSEKVIRERFKAYDLSGIAGTE